MVMMVKVLKSFYWVFLGLFGGRLAGSGGDGSGFVRVFRGVNDVWVWWW